MVGKGNDTTPGFKDFLESNGAVGPKDGSGVPCSTYLKDLGDMKVDWLEGKLPQNDSNKQEQIPVQPQEANAGSMYEVKTGDNLSTIAQKQGTTVDKLLAIPGNEKYKDNPDLIHPGDKVNIAAPDAGTQQSQPEPVQSGNQESPNTQASEPAHQETNTQPATSTEMSNQATEEQKQVEQMTNTEAKPEAEGSGLVDSLNKFVR